MQLSYHWIARSRRWLQELRSWDWSVGAKELLFRLWFTDYCYGFGEGSEDHLKTAA